MHHLVSWPLTLHLVARVHNAGKLDTTKDKQQTIEKAVLYKSIVSETAIRQQEQSSDGGGRLTPDQMREFVQAISWEMYSTSRDALEYTEGLPLLKSIYPAASEIELADLADVAIVNQPELTKGEEGGFEFVHKSFSEYFVAEKFARTIEKASFKSKDYDTDKLTWRMSVKEAIGELSSLISIRVITAEVQEMLEPMLADFKEFVHSTRKAKAEGLAEKLQTKKVRMEELLGEYTSGSYQTEVVERVRDSRIVRNERDIHANFSIGLLVLGCALTKRLARLGTTKAERDKVLLVDDNRLWKLISIIQAGEIQLDIGLAERCLSPLRIGSGTEPIEVSYPPIPTRLLHGVTGAIFPIEEAIEALIDMAAALIVENMLISILGSGDPREIEFRTHRYLRHSGGSRFGNLFSDILDKFNRVGVIPRRIEQQLDGRAGFLYFERNIEEVLDRMMREERPRLDRRQLREIHHILREYVSRYGGRASSYIVHEVMKRLEHQSRLIADR